ncbi:MAG: T9SS type A sorting domain-containing protein [Bacteroidales bacterium]|nr:T9SS type A sorting domain-containing protein [Bacteroidales bacterium]
MKAIYKLLVIVAMLVMSTLAFALPAKPTDTDDTIPAFPRSDDYYYTKWYDDCPNFHPDGVVDSCLCRLYKFHDWFSGSSSPAKWEHAPGRMKIKGLVAMLQHYSPPTVDSLPGQRKRPEYLYLYQLTGRHHTLRQDYLDGVDLQILDSVRWDTATARVMELRRGWNGEYNQYCYLYEAYFKTPVYVDTDFYIRGTINSNYQGSGRDGMIHTLYVDILDLYDYVFKDDKECNFRDYWEELDVICEPQGWPFVIYDQFDPTIGWYDFCGKSPVGYYLVIADKWTLDATPEDSLYGQVLGGGRWPDESYDTIEAVPNPGYIFLSWNDGNTDNPRVVHLLSDTSFMALFLPNGEFALQVTSADETQGSVSGSGTFLDGTDNTITATPFHEYKFTQWNDNVTDNPRVVHLVSDTSFTAYFEPKPYYNVQTATSNDDLGEVLGGGLYMEGEDATLTVSVAQNGIFEGWDDGVTDQPRIVTVMQDTLFTALFSEKEGIDGVGSLTFAVSPNPTTGRITLTTGLSEAYEVSVMDMNGKTLLNRKSHVAVTEADLSELPAGQYLLVVRTRDRFGARPIVKK